MTGGRAAWRIVRVGVAPAAAAALAGCAGVASGPVAGTGSTTGPPALTSPATSRATSPVSSASAASEASEASAASATSASRLAQAQRTHEYPGPALREDVAGGWRSPAQAVRVFAATYINWTAATVADRLRALAQVSVGRARSAVTLEAAESTQDYELHRGGIANTGTVEAVAALAGQPRQYVVVTLERTTATHSATYRGLAPAWHVALATVTPVGSGLWVLSAWQPEG